MTEPARKTANTPRRQAALVAPVDFASTEGVADWRERVAWPLSHRDSYEMGRGMLRRFLAAIGALTEPEPRDAALLAAGRTFTEILPLAELARAVQAEAESGIVLQGASAELEWLRGAPASLEAIVASGRNAFKPAARPKAITARRLARIAGWSPIWRVPLDLLSPEAVAISHNALLREAAARDGVRVGFRHAEQLLAEARRAAPPEAAPWTGALADHLVEAVLSASGVREPGLGRLREAARARARPLIAAAAGDLAGMRSVRRLPSRLWSGTGGYWPSRCAGLEVLRRGGEVTRFEHGCAAGMLRVVEPVAMTELSVSSEYVLPTPALAEHLHRSGASGLLAPFGEARLSGRGGEPGIRTLHLRSTPRSDRRRVLYAPSILQGSRQFVPPFLPDPVHLDWQFRLTEGLMRLPVELVVRAHPEGLLRGRVHPLTKLLPLAPQPFEALMPEADLFVFDYHLSTTFYEAVCTDRPIVLIDMGNPVFAPAIRNLVERRCRVIAARFDSRNRPHVDAEALTEAVCGGDDRADPAEFRSLLLGAS